MARRTRVASQDLAARAPLRALRTGNPGCLYRGEPFWRAAEACEAGERFPARQSRARAEREKHFPMKCFARPSREQKRHSARKRGELAPLRRMSDSEARRRWVHTPAHSFVIPLSIT